MPDDFFDTAYLNNSHDQDQDRFVELGDDINLSAKDPTMTKIMLGVGWDSNAFDAEAMDLDISLFLLDKNDMTRVDEDFLFYNQEEILDGAVKHMGDSRTGAGEGDDEQILIDLHGVPFDILRIMVSLTIYQSYEKRLELGQVRGAYIRVCNGENKYELCRYVLDEQLKNRPEGGVLIAALDREGPKWHFRPLAEFEQMGLPDIATKYGIIVKEKV